MATLGRLFASAGATLALAVIWWGWRHATPAQQAVLGYYDTFEYYLPTFAYAFGVLAGGKVPFWNPYQHCGTPFFATAQHVLLYPLNLPFLLFETPVAMAVMAVLHIVLAGLAMDVLARTMGLGAMGAGVAAVAFAFSPRVAGLATLPHHLYAVTWMPLVCAFAVRMAEQPRRARWAVGLGIVGAVQYLGGYPQLCLYTWYLAGAAFLWRLARGWRAGTVRPSWAHLAAGAGAAALLVSLSAPQLFPSFELAREGVRNVAGLSIDEADPTYGSATPWRTIGFAVLGFRGEAMGPGVPSIGTVGFVLALLAGLDRRQRGVTRFWLVVAAVSVLLSLGRSTPLFAWYFLLPTANLFRMPERLAVVAVLALALLAGIGVEGLRERRGRMCAALHCGALGALVWGLSWTLPDWSALDALAVFDPANEPGTWARARALVWYLLGASAALFLLRDARRADVGWTARLAVFLGVAWGWWNVWALPEVRGDDYRMPPEVAAYVRDHQGYERTALARQNLGLEWPLPAKAGMQDRLYVLGDRENVYPHRLAEFFDRVAPPDREAALERVHAFLNATGHHVPQGEVVVTARSAWRLLALAGVRFVVESPWRGFYEESDPHEFPVVFQALGYRVLENPTVLPRAFVAHRAEVVAPDQVFDRLLDEHVDLRTTAILEAPPPLSLTAQARTWRSFDQADIVRYESDVVEVVATTMVPALLVLTDQFYPGWEAEVDGVPAPIVRADGIFRAVPLAPGKHRVRFRFRPRSVRLGFGLAGLAVGGMLVLVGVPSLRRRL